MARTPIALAARAGALLALAALLAACGGAAPSPTPPTSPTPPVSPGPTPLPTPIVVDTPEAAFERVVGWEPRFRGMMGRDPELIGQSAWYEVAAEGDRFIVNVTIGWGDCPAGCIENHRWQFSVARDGEVTLLGEEGPRVPPAVWPSPSGTGLTGIFITAVAGPVCPVERPGDPACEPRPVAGATVVVRGEGREVARVLTDAMGNAFVELPPGEYVVESGPVDGLLGTPGAFMVEVYAGAESTAYFGYDTGIR